MRSDDRQIQHYHANIFRLPASYPTRVSLKSIFSSYQNHSEVHIPDHLRDVDPFPEVEDLGLRIETGLQG